MAQLNIEAIYSTLFTRLAAISGIVSSDRRLRSISDIQPSNMPYLSMEQGDIMQETQANPRLPKKWVLLCDVIVYTTVGSDPAVTPMMGLNAIVAAIITSLEPDPGYEVQKIGLAYLTSVKIEGKVLMLDDAINGNGIAVIPVRIVTALQ